MLVTTTRAEDATRIAAGIIRTDPLTVKYEIVDLEAASLAFADSLPDDDDDDDDVL